MNAEFYKGLVISSIKEGIERHVAGAVIRNGLFVLILQRPLHEFMGGIYELPSGKVEGGESLDAALQREVVEETGLTVVKIAHYLGHFDYKSGSGKRTRQFNFVVNIKPDLEVRLSEHVSSAWISPDMMDKYELTSATREILKKYRET